MRGLANVMTGGADIDLRRAERCVAKQGLDDVDRLATADELHRDGVPECVSRRARGEGTPARRYHCRTWWSSAAGVSALPRLFSHTGLSRRVRRAVCSARLARYASSA